LARRGEIMSDRAKDEIEVKTKWYGARRRACDSLYEPGLSVIGTELHVEVYQTARLPPEFNYRVAFVSNSGESICVAVGRGFRSLAEARDACDVRIVAVAESALAALRSSMIVEAFGPQSKRGES
jgi:hypothetical protein